MRKRATWPAHPTRRSSRRKDGGERGIRTLGRVSPTHAFQACSIDHSDISPFRINHLRAVWNSVAQNLPSIPPVPPCNLDSTTYGLYVQRSSRELCKTLQGRRITYGDLPEHVFEFLTVQT